MLDSHFLYVLLSFLGRLPAQILLFFLLIFLVGSSIYYSFSDNVGFRSFLYLLTSAVSAASYWGSRPAMKKLALVLDRQTNTCRFPSGPLEGLSYPITEKPLDTLLRARVHRKKAVVKSSGPYGAPIRVSTTLRKITLEFSDGQMIGWEEKPPKFPSKASDKQNK
jgi:hypothetical protein